MIASITDHSSSKRVAELLHFQLRRILIEKESNEEFETCAHIIQTQEALSKFILGYMNNTEDVQIIMYLTLQVYFEFHDIVTLSDSEDEFDLSSLREEQLVWYAINEEYIGIMVTDSMIQKIKELAE